MVGLVCRLFGVGEPTPVASSVRCRAVACVTFGDALGRCARCSSRVILSKGDGISAGGDTGGTSRADCVVRREFSSPGSLGKAGSGKGFARSSSPTSVRSLRRFGVVATASASADVGWRRCSLRSSRAVRAGQGFLTATRATRWFNRLGASASERWRPPHGGCLSQWGSRRTYLGCFRPGEGPSADPNRSVTLNVGSDRGASPDSIGGRGGRRVEAVQLVQGVFGLARGSRCRCGQSME